MSSEEFTPKPQLQCRDDGVGLAAPQVGINVRLMVFNVEGVRGKGEEMILVNPRIISPGKQLSTEEEACLSFRLGNTSVFGDVEVGPTRVVLLCSAAHFVAAASS
jgi:peptide deformylase